nr:MAG TPA: hypothetical protein [Caudoviricetes sp.]
MNFSTGSATNTSSPFGINDLECCSAVLHLLQLLQLLHCHRADATSCQPRMFLDCESLYQLRHRCQEFR